MANDLIAYEEEKQLTDKINAIIGQKDFALNKLKGLRNAVTSPLSQSHIDYYIHRLQSDFLLRIGQIISFVMVMVYLIFILFRVYWFYHPEKNPLSPFKITVNELIIWFYYAVSFGLVIYVIYRVMCHFLSRK